MWHIGKFPPPHLDSVQFYPFGIHHLFWGVEDSSASSGGGGVMAILLISLAAVVLDKR